jgi:polyketide cyclase/dehydrase/lipid transport protein
MPTWTHEHAVDTPASPEAAWAVLADVAAWPTWDHEVEHAQLDGPLERGVTGTLKPAGGPTTRFTVIESEAPRRMTDVTRLPLARLTFDHRYAPAPGGGTRLTHAVRIEGPLSPLFARIIGRRVVAGLPQAMAALAAKAVERDTVAP